MDDRNPQLPLEIDTINTPTRKSHEEDRTRDYLIKLLKEIISSRGYQEELLLDSTPQMNKAWSFFLPSEFKDSLDIRFLTLIRKSNEPNWYQGASFSFSQGQIIYDKKQAYELPWSEALRNINVCLHIKNATAVVPEERKRFVRRIDGKRDSLKSFRQKEIYISLLPDELPIREAKDLVKESTGKIPSDGVLKTMAKLDVVKIREEVKPRNPGNLYFDKYSPNESMTSLKLIGSYSTTQDSFVEYLITGDLPSVL